MQGDQLGGQWRAVLSIEAGPNGLTIAEIGKREEPGNRAMYSNLEALQEVGLLHAQRVQRANRLTSIDIFKFITPLFSPRKAAESAKKIAYPSSTFFPIVESYFIRAKGILRPWRLSVTVKQDRELREKRATYSERG